METTIAAVIGVAIALFGAVPDVWALELGIRGDDRATIERGLIGVLISFAISSVLLFAAYLLLAGSFRACGIAFAVTLVLVWCIESVRAYLLM